MTTHTCLMRKPGSLTTQLPALHDKDWQTVSDVFPSHIDGEMCSEKKYYFFPHDPFLLLFFLC